MHQDFEPRHSLQKRPVLPRRMQIDAHLDVEHVAEDAALRARPSARACWARSEAENSSRRRVFARGISRESAARRRDRVPSASGSAPRAPAATAPGHRRSLSGGIATSKTAPGVAAASSIEANTRAIPNASARSRLASGFTIENSRDRKSEPLVHRQMRVANDAAGADHHDRSRRRRTAAMPAADQSGADREYLRFGRHRRSRDATMPRRRSDHGANNYPDYRSATSERRRRERWPAPTRCIPTPTIPPPTSS